MRCGTLHRFHRDIWVISNCLWPRVIVLVVFNIIIISCGGGSNCFDGAGESMFGFRLNQL
jgi:hypothetical protein